MRKWEWIAYMMKRIGYEDDAIKLAIEVDRIVVADAGDKDTPEWDEFCDSEEYRKIPTVATLSDIACEPEYCTLCHKYDDDCEKCVFGERVEDNRWTDYKCGKEFGLAICAIDEGV
jgi:hypothetical protein